VLAPTYRYGACGEESGRQLADEAEEMDWIAVVGSMCSSTASELALRLQPVLPNAVVVSGSSTLAALGDAAQYPNFVRTVPPDSIDTALNVILQFGWRRVVLIVEEGETASSSAASLESQLQQYAVKVLTVAAPLVMDTDVAEGIAARPEVRDATVLILVMFRPLPLLEALERQNHFDRPGVVMNPWLDSDLPRSNNSLVLSLVPLTLDQPKINDFYQEWYLYLESVLSLEITDDPMEDRYSFRAFEAVHLLANSLLESKVVDDPLADIVRQQRFRSIFGNFSFSAEGAIRNNPVYEENLEIILAIDTLSARSMIGVYSSVDGSVQLLYAEEEWQVKADVAPMACNRGTFGQRTEIGYRCVPCPAGSYAAEENSESCTACPSATTCPFNAPGPISDVARMPVGSNELQLRSRHDDDGFVVVGVVFPLSVVGVFVMSTVLVFRWGKLTPARPRLGNWLRSVDLLFTELHYHSPGMFLSEYQTILGGVLNIVFVVAAVTTVLIVSLLLTAAPPTFVSFQLQSTRQFQLAKASAIVLDVFALGVDTGPVACSSNHSLSPLVGHVIFSGGVTWETTTQVDSGRSGCHLSATLDVATLKRLPSTFSLSYRIPQGTVHGWQWRLAGRFIGFGEGTLTVTGNRTVEEGVLSGAAPTTVALGLQRTLFQGLTGAEKHGLTPTMFGATLGDVLPSHPNATNHLVSGAAINLTLTVLPGMRREQQNGLDYVAAVALIVGLLSLTQRVVVLLKIALEWMFVAGTPFEAHVQDRMSCCRTWAGALEEHEIGVDC